MIEDTDKKQLIDFLKRQKILVLATKSDDSSPWVSNVYFSVDDELNFFFVGPEATSHSRHIAKDPQVAFSVAWHDPNDLTNRKAIQATGTCQKLTDPGQIIKFIQNHHQSYPVFKNLITYAKMRNKVISSRPYIIRPNYIKFWNDELFGENAKEYVVK